MNLYLCGLSGITDILESFESAIWNVQFFECGDFQLICPYSDALYQLLEPGKYLVRETDIIQGDEFHNVMEISKRIITFDPEKGWRLEVSGSGLKKIIGQRVIWNQTNFEQENVETAIRQVITDNIIDPVDPDRKINNFILADAIGFADVFDAQLFSENLSEWMTSVCTMYGYGWDVYIKNGKYVFALIEGTDRSFESDDPVIFSEEFENIGSIEYEYDRSDFHNVGLVGGEGEGSSQVITYVGSGSGLNRREVYIDGGDVSSNGEIITMETYISMLQTYGQEQLTASQFIQKFEGELILNGLYEFGKDYFLGDYIQIIFKGISAKSRIIEMIYSEDANGSTLLPTFSDWEVST